MVRGLTPDGGHGVNPNINRLGFRVPWAGRGAVVDPAPPHAAPG